MDPRLREDDKVIVIDHKTKFRTISFDEDDSGGFLSFRIKSGIYEDIGCCLLVLFCALN